MMRQMTMEILAESQGDEKEPLKGRGEDLPLRIEPEKRME